MLEFDKSVRFTRFVLFLQKQGIVKLDKGVPSVAKPDVLDDIGLGFFIHYVARGMTPSRRVTFVPLSNTETAIVVEPLPVDEGIFLRGPQESDYAPTPIPSTMHATNGLCPGRALVHANWATYMNADLPELPVCGGCQGDDRCVTVKWIAARLIAHPDEGLGIVGGHVVVLNAPPAVFELVGTEPVVDEPDMEAELAGAKRLDMKYFDAYVTLDLGSRAKAKVYIPNTQLAKPVRSPYECDVVVYDEKIEYLAVVETAIGVGPDDPEAIEEEKLERAAIGAPPTIPSLAIRLRRKHSSHSGFAALGIKSYRYVYASVGTLNFGDGEKSHGAYTRHLMQAEPPMTIVELAAVVPEILELRTPRWWKPDTLRAAFVQFRDAIRDGAAP